jgi:hypothetical protein
MSIRFNRIPESVEVVWNFLGYANTAWHRVNVRVEG